MNLTLNTSILSRIVGAITHGVLLCRPDTGEIVHANAYLEQLLGYSATDLDGMTLTDLFLPQFPPCD